MTEPNNFKEHSDKDEHPWWLAMVVSVVAFISCEGGLDPFRSCVAKKKEITRRPPS